MATDLERFFEYARAFEVAYMSDDWAVLEPYFDPDAHHIVRDGGPAGCDDRGGKAVVEGLRHGALEIDRRFDVRIAEVIEGPTCRADGIWMRFGMTLRRAGLPDLTIEGQHLARYDGGRIVALDERLAPRVSERIEAYLAEHGAKLRPAGSPFNFDVDLHDRRELDLALQRTLVRCYASAKSRQDVGAALAVCSEDFCLETVCLGLTTADRDAAGQQLEIFFTAFPDYQTSLEGITAEGRYVACWGAAHMTFGGPFAGHAPTGKTAIVPCTSIFECADGQIRGERFYFDLETLCRQIKLPTSVVLDAVGPLRVNTSADPGGAAQCSPGSRLSRSDNSSETSAHRSEGSRTGASTA